LNYERIQESKKYFAWVLSEIAWDSEEQKRAAVAWPHDFPPQKPSCVSKGDWLCAHQARDALHYIRTFEQLRISDGRGVNSQKELIDTAFSVGWNLAAAEKNFLFGPYMPYAEGVLSNIDRMHERRERDYMGRLAAIVEKLPSIDWSTRTNGVQELSALTSISTRRLWDQLDSLRNADTDLLDRLSELTRLPNLEIAKRIGRIPKKAQKNLSDTR
jgi:hypothetical protein